MRMIDWRERHQMSGWSALFLAVRNSNFVQMVEILGLSCLGKIAGSLKMDVEYSDKSE